LPNGLAVVSVPPSLKSRQSVVKLWWVVAHQSFRRLMEKQLMLTKRQRKNVELPATFEARFWELADQRNGMVKKIRRRIELLKEDSGCDSYQKELLIQRAVFLASVIETMEVKAVELGQLDVGSFTQAVNALSGLLSKLGLDKKFKKKIGLNAYLEDKS
jgi:hypothetical protein